MPTGGAAEPLIGADGQPITLFDSTGVNALPVYENEDGSRYVIENGQPRALIAFENQIVDSALPELPGYIGGFPETYRPETETAPMTPRTAAVSIFSQSYDTGPPRYRVGDEWAQFAAMSPEYIATVQGAMVRAGLMDEADVSDVWTGTAATAMANAMLVANARGGDSWVNVLRQMEEEAPSDADRMQAAREANPFIAPVYRAPDVATLKQGVRAEFSRMLGREVHDWEFGMFVEQLGSDFKAQHAAEVSAARSTYEAQIRAGVTGESGGGGSVQSVDPFARMSERFLSLYQPEIDAEESEEEFGLNTANLQRALSGIESIVGG